MPAHRAGESFEGRATLATTISWLATMTTEVISRGFQVSAMAAMLLTVTGCGSGQTSAGTSTGKSAPLTSESPNNIDYTMQWTTPKALLMTPDGTFVRAFVESEIVGEIAGGPTAVYPGFTQANHGAINPGVFGTDTTMGSPTMYFGLVGIHDMPGGGARATVCYWFGGASGGSSYLYYQREGTSPPSNQTGPRTAPTRDVFGDWYATKEQRQPKESLASEQCRHTAPVNPSKAGQPSPPPSPGWPR